MTGLSAREAAELIGVPHATIGGWVRRGILRPSLPGKLRRITLADLEAAQRTVHAGDVVPRWREDPRHAGLRLREMREAQRLTQEALALRAGLTHEEISRLEAGEKSPIAATLAKLERGLGINVALLVAHTPLGLSLLTTEEAARLLGVPPRRVRKWTHDGVLPGVKVGCHWRIPAVAVYELDRSGRLRGDSRRLDG